MLGQRYEDVRTKFMPDKIFPKFWIFSFFSFFLMWLCDPTRVMAFSFLRFLDHTQRRTTVGRTSLDEWSARRRDLYLTTHDTHNRQTSMPPVVFELTISAGERPQTYALDRAGTETGNIFSLASRNQKQIGRTKAWKFYHLFEHLLCSSRSASLKTLNKSGL